MRPLATPVVPSQESTWISQIHLDLCAMYRSVITTSVCCADRRVGGHGQSVERDQLQKDACAVTWLVWNISIFSFVAEKQV